MCPPLRVDVPQISMSLRSGLGTSFKFAFSFSYKSYYLLLCSSTLAPSDIMRACSYRDRKGRMTRPQWRHAPSGKQYSPCFNMAPAAHWLGQQKCVCFRRLADYLFWNNQFFVCGNLEFGNNLFFFLFLEIEKNSEGNPRIKKKT